MRTGYSTSTNNSDSALLFTKPSAFVFPAFPADFKDHPAKGVSGFDKLFERFLAEATAIHAPELIGYQIGKPLQDALSLQYFTYIYGCTAGSVLKNRGFAPDFVAGYSMGIYAALVQTESITFRSGLELIRLAYEALTAGTSDFEAAMGVIIGLSDNDILELIDQYALFAEISNQNASHSFVVSGRQHDVLHLLDLAKLEGALHVRDMKVAMPYHYSRMENAARVFGEAARQIEINHASVPLISLVDQKAVIHSDHIRTEVVRNLHCPLNWMKTQQAMAELGVSLFIETGPSKALVKNAKFIPGNYEFYGMDKFL
jgi:[acyl-carrier-protein] S-malonyltransferase